MVRDEIVRLTRAAFLAQLPRPVFLIERDPTSLPTFLSINVAAGDIDEDEQRVCAALFARLGHWIPHLQILLTASHETTWARVQSRARTAETTISEAFIREVSSAHAQNPVRVCGSHRVTITTECKSKLQVYKEVLVSECRSQASPLPPACTNHAPRLPAVPLLRPFFYQRGTDHVLLSLATVPARSPLFSHVSRRQPWRPSTQRTRLYYGRLGRHGGRCCVRKGAGVALLRPVCRGRHAGLRRCGSAEWCNSRDERFRPLACRFPCGRAKRAGFWNRPPPRRATASRRRRE